MKVEIELYDDCADRIVLARLHGTLNDLLDPKFPSLPLDGDEPEIITALKTLIAYFRIPGEE